MSTGGALAAGCSSAPNGARSGPGGAAALLLLLLLPLAGFRLLSLALSLATLATNRLVAPLHVSQD
jgi:hypothetical protein